MDSEMKSVSTPLPTRKPISPLACAECDRLWQELSSAAKAYVRMVVQYKGVDGRRRVTPHSKLELRVAAEHRNCARKALKAHDAKHLMNSSARA